MTTWPATPAKFNWHSEARLVDNALRSPALASIEAHSSIGTLRKLVRTGGHIHLYTPQVLAKLSMQQDQMVMSSTSGSSGSPKTLYRTASSWIKSFEENAARFNLEPSDCAVVFGSFESSLALYGVLEAAHIGADIMTLCGVRPDKQVQCLKQAEATVLYLTPTQMEMIAHEDVTHETNVRLILIGGGKLQPSLRIRAYKSFPDAEIIEFYGTAETSFITITDGTEPMGSVGSAYPNVEIHIEPRDDGLGEVWVRSPYLFEGYQTPNENITKWWDGFLSVGELGYLDEDGYLFLHGRSNRMVTVSDKNVFLDEVEAHLKQYCLSEAVIVLGHHGGKRGNVISAVFGKTVKESLAEDAVKHCRKKLGLHCAPRHIYFIDAIPYLGSGKPDLVKLSQWVQNKP